MFSLGHAQLLAQRNNLKAELAIRTEESPENGVESYPQTYNLRGNDFACINLVNFLTYRPLAAHRESLLQ